MNVFATTKPVIAMVHFPALPGRPRHDRAGGRARLLDVVGRDLEVLQDAGVDGVLFCNEADIPYQLTVGPEIPAAMAAVIGELRPSIRVPFGVNILWDAKASVALARATGASFVREVLTGVYESDLGLIAPALGELAGYQTAIGAADVALFDNITPEFSSSIGSRTVAERARSASFLGVDAILVSGPQAGVPMNMSDLRSAKAAAPDTPVLANTGVQADRLAEILPVADGVIVGTSLKVDGITWNPVDPARARLVDDSTARLRRIERDLHDGAQAQLVAVTMKLGLAAKKLGGMVDGTGQTDLDRVLELVAAAHRGVKEAITELRDLARGIHPSVLDQGLGIALTTLAARSDLPVDLVVDLPERPSAAIETIAYFCAAELLTNVTKHSGAHHATLEAIHAPGLLRMRVSDDGTGGARIEAGSGLAGLADRVRTVDGSLHVASPPGGPTVVTIELPSHA